MDKMIVAYVDRQDSEWSGSYCLLGVFTSIEEVKKAYPSMKCPEYSRFYKKTYENNIRTIEVPVNQAFDHDIGSYDG